MENSNKTASIAETQSKDAYSGYFERAGSLGIVALMALFYTALVTFLSIL